MPLLSQQECFAPHFSFWREPLRCLAFLREEGGNGLCVCALICMSSFLRPNRAMLKVAKKQLAPEARPMVFTRGRADVSLIKQLLSSRGASIWTDEVWFLPCPPSCACARVSVFYRVRKG